MATLLPPNGADGRVDVDSIRTHEEQTVPILPYHNVPSVELDHVHYRENLFQQ